MAIIKLQSNDGEIFDIDIATISKFSGTIKSMIEDCGMNQGDDADTDEEPVPLPKLNSVILRKIIDWANFHKDDLQKDDETRVRLVERELWDAEFVKVDQGTLFELIMAANYLDAKDLLDLSCRAVAKMIKGKTPEEIRKTFNIKNDFTAAEEAQVRRENLWCEEK